jgi:hypothetical protein
MATLAQLEATLQAAGEPFHVLPLHDGMRALFTQRGARMLGLFPDGDGANLLWTNAALTDVDAFRAFVSAGEWNLGGERCWIAPEIQFNVADRNDFWGTISVPPQMDPGHYRMSIGDEAVRFEAEMMLMAHNLATGDKRLRVARVIRPAANPLPEADGVQFAGLAHTAALTELDDAPIVSEIWNLVQLPAGGTLVIPVIGAPRPTRYFGNPAPDTQTVVDGALQIALTGAQQYKVGYPAVSMTGRMGYWRMLADGRASLLVRSFFNDPANLYAEEPPDEPGRGGHSVHIYNDGGEFSAAERFGEMEASGHTLGSKTGLSSSVDTFHLWAYIGAAEALRPIARALSGVQP